MLAVRDGDFETFSSLYPRVPDRANDLLIEVSGRPGRIGGNMVLMLLSAVEQFSPEAYLTACKRAVDTGDSQRVRTLVDEAKSHLSEPRPSLAGEVMVYAYTCNRKSMARELIDKSTPEQIAAAPSALLRQAAASLDLQAAVTLIDKGIRPGDHVEDILRTLTGQHQEWMAEQLLAHGMPVGPDNYAALYVCINNGMPGAAKLVLDQGIDFDKYRAWADNKPKSAEYEAAMEALYEYMTEQKNTVQRDGPTMGGMCR